MDRMERLECVNDTLRILRNENALLGEMCQRIQEYVIEERFLPSELQDNLLNLVENMRDEQNKCRAGYRTIVGSSDLPDSYAEAERRLKKQHELFCKEDIVQSAVIFKRLATDNPDEADALRKAQEKTVIVSPANITMDRCRERYQPYMDFLDALCEEDAGVRIGYVKKLENYFPAELIAGAVITHDIYDPAESDSYDDDLDDYDEYIEEAVASHSYIEGEDADWDSTIHEEVTRQSEVEGSAKEAENAEDVEEAAEGSETDESAKEAEFAEAEPAEEVTEKSEMEEPAKEAEAAEVETEEEAAEEPWTKEPVKEAEAAKLEPEQEAAEKAGTGQSDDVKEGAGFFAAQQEYTTMEEGDPSIGFEEKAVSELTAIDAEESVSEVILQAEEAENLSADEEVPEEPAESRREVARTDGEYLTDFDETYIENYLQVSDLEDAMTLVNLPAWPGANEVFGQEGVKRVLEAVGFEVATALEQDKIRGKYENYHVVLGSMFSLPEGRSESELLATFGREASTNGFRVVCLYGSFTGEELSRAFREVGNRYHTLILFQNPVTQGIRRSLVKLARRPGLQKEFAVLDRVAYRYLDSHYDAEDINSMFFDIIMPKPESV